MHPPEPIYPCYLPVLGEFNRMTPHEGPSTSLPEVFEPSEFADMHPARAKKMDMSLLAHSVPRDMSPVRAKGWAYQDYVQCSCAGEGMSG